MNFKEQTSFDRMKNKNHIIYVMGTFDNPVIKSQLLSWISMLDQKGQSSEIVSFVSLSTLVLNRKGEAAAIKEFRKTYKGAIKQIPIYRALDKKNKITRWIKYWVLRGIIKNRNRQQGFNKITLQTRTLTNYVPIKKLKKSLPWLKLIFDLRGAGALEHLNANGVSSVEGLRDEKIKKSFQKFLYREKEMIKLSDVTFAVSLNLKDKLRKTPYLLDTEKVHVMPGAADNNYFFYKLSIRNRKRQQLQLNNKYVIIYSGGLQNFYQRKDLVFEFASRILNLDKRYYFICLTKDTEMVPKLVDKYKLPSKQFHVIYTKSHQEINEYLNAADLGLIFRDDILTNNVSSPTKVPEYLLSGLPVMISQNVGDYSDFIDENELGIVVDNHIDRMIESFENIVSRHYDREKISRITSMQYSKQAVLGKKMKILQEL